MWWVFSAFPSEAPSTCALVTVFLPVENNWYIPILKFLRSLNLISRLEIPYSIGQKLRAAVIPALHCSLWGAVECFPGTDALLASPCFCCQIHDAWWLLCPESGDRAKRREESGEEWCPSAEEVWLGSLCIAPCPGNELSPPSAWW